MVKSQQCHYRIKNIYVKSLPIRLKRKNYEMHAKWIKIRIISLIIMNKLLSKLLKFIQILRNQYNEMQLYDIRYKLKVIQNY